MARDPELSPELVLVSPELAARARAELPDRPWEAFAPPRPAVPLAPPRAAPAAQGSRRLERLVAAFPLLLLLGFVALLVVGSLPGFSQRPTLAPPSTSTLPTPQIVVGQQPAPGEDAKPHP